MQMVLHDPESHVTTHFNCLDLRNEMVPLTVLLASYQYWCQWCHTTKKTHFLPHFTCLILRNAMVPLMMMLASCDTDANANGMKLPKSHDAPHFDNLGIKNTVLPLTMP